MHKEGGGDFVLGKKFNINKFYVCILIVIIILKIKPQPYGNRIRLINKLA